MEVGSLGASSSTGTVGSEETGFAGLNSDAFMRLLITELQNQDPLEPLGNEELLSQLSMMRNLQSNIELGEALKAITNGQQLATAAGYIGRMIEGTDSGQNSVSGVVERAFLADGTAYVAVGAHTIPLEQVHSIAVDAL